MMPHAPSHRHRPTSPARNRPKKAQPAAVALTGRRIVSPAPKPRRNLPEATPRIVHVPSRKQRDAWRRFLALTGQDG